MNLAMDQRTGMFKGELSALSADFGRGLNENKNILPGQSPFLINTFANDDNAIQLRPKEKTISTQTFHAKRTYSYIAKDNSERCAMTDNAKVHITTNMISFSVIPDVAGPPSELTLNPNYETRFTSYNNNLWGTNGFDPVWTFDGSTLTKPAWLTITPRYLITFQDRIWFLNTPTNPQYLYYTDLGAGGYNPLNVIKIESKSSGTGTGLAVTKNGLVIFKNDSVWLLQGYDESTFNLINISDRIGCINADSIQEYNGAIVFLGFDGFYKTDGVRVIKIFDYIPNSRGEISQAYKWTYFEDVIKDTLFLSDVEPTMPFIDYTAYYRQSNLFWNNMIPTDRGGNFVSEIFDFNRVYNAIGSNWWPKNNTFNTLADWNIKYIDDNAIQWSTPGNAELRLTRRANANPYVRRRFKMRVSIVCTDDNTEIAYYEQWNPPPGNGSLQYEEPNIWHTQTISLAGIDPKYCYKPCIYRITLFGIEGYSWNILDPAKEMFVIESSEFYIDKDVNVPSFEWKINNGTELLSGLIYTSFTNFYGVGAFTYSNYQTGTIPIDQSDFGVVSYEYTDWAKEKGETPYATIQLYMAFSNNGGATWYDFGGGNIWTPVTSGTSINTYDPFGHGSCNAIKFSFQTMPGGSPSVSYYPVELISIYYSWYDAIDNVPKSNDNISSVIWNNRYLLSYTKAGEKFNRFVIVYDEVSGESRFHKWFHYDGVSCFSFFANKVFFIANNYIAGGLTVFQYAFDDYDREVREAAYFTAELDFAQDGVLKDFDNIIAVYDKNGQPSNYYDLKIEVWIDGKYNGDLAIYERTDVDHYFSVKHTALRKYVGIWQYDTIQIRWWANTPGPGGVIDTFSDVPIGFGNKIQFRIFFGHPATSSSVIFETQWGKQLLKTIGVSGYLNQDAFLEPDLNLYEGAL